MRQLTVGLGYAAIALTPAGCSAGPDARYDYQDGQYGVIGIPKNTTKGPKDFRKQAVALMEQHFPEGYEIVRAEEVVESKRSGLM